MADLVDRRAASSASRSGWHSGNTWTPVPIFYPLGAGRNRARQGQGRGATSVPARPVDLGQPHRIEPPALGASTCSKEIEKASSSVIPAVR